MAWNHVPLKRGSQRKSTSRKVLPSLGSGRRVVDHVITWRSHTAAVLLATAPLVPATPGHIETPQNPNLDGETANFIPASAAAAAIDTVHT